MLSDFCCKNHVLSSSVASEFFFFFKWRLLLFVYSPRRTRSSWWSFYWRRLLLCWSFWGSRRRSEPECWLLWATEHTHTHDETAMTTLRFKKAVKLRWAGKKRGNLIHQWRRDFSVLLLFPGTLWHQGPAAVMGDRPPAADICQIKITTGKNRPF